MTVKYLVISIFIMGLFSGCGKEEIRVYTVPKEEGTNPPVVNNMPGGMSAQNLPEGSMSSADNPDWVVPEGWEEGQVSSIRRGSYKVAEGGQMLDISVTVFPGDVGGLLANINRWRGQIGLPPVTAEALPELIAEAEVNGQSMTWVDLKGDSLSTLAAIFFVNGSSWFFKMTGPNGLVESEAGRFRQFVESVQYL